MFSCETYKLFKNTLFEVCERLLLKPVLSLGLPFLVIYVLLANSPFTTIDTATIRSYCPLVLCEKGVPTNFANFTRKHLLLGIVFNKVANLQSLTLSKTRFRCRCFLVNSGKFLIKLFLRKPWDGCFYINTRFVYFPFQKRCHTYFPAEYFLGLICRLRIGVSPIFQTLSWKPIFNPIQHLRWSFYYENS